MPMLSSRLRSSALAGLTAAVMTSGALVPVSSAQAAPTFGALAAYTAAGEGSVLDLEGDDDAKASALTRALRTSFAARGVGGGKEMSAIELKLTMGCDDPPAAACMAEGGKTLGVKNMVYGSLKKAGAGYTVELTLLDVDGATVKETLSAPLSADALEGGVIDQTAKDLVDQMLGVQEASPEPTEPTPVVAPPPEEEPEESGSRLVWGKHDAAKWKKIGLYTSAGLMVASLGTAVVTSLMVRRGGPIYNDLIDAANASLEDDKKANDINPNTGEDLCSIARTEPPGEPGTVTNASVAKVCKKGDTFAKIATITWVTTGVFAASTIAFTTLLFVHKEKNETMARLQRRGTTLGVAPLRGGGAMVGGSFRF
ncbi:MAG: hypothetical protein H6711_33260 [Myxococcales bacterium]|nr:hypothetical protein [Myxococcales bacterium]